MLMATALSLFTVTPLTAQTVVNDGLTDNSAKNTPGGPGELDIPWVQIRAGSSFPATTTDVAFASAPIMRLSPGGGNRPYLGMLYGASNTALTTNYVSRAAAPSVTLGSNVGDKIRLMYDFRNTALRSDTISVGLFNSKGTKFVDGNTSTTADDTGYYVSFREGLTTGVIPTVSRDNGAGGGTTDNGGLFGLGNTGDATSLIVTGTSYLLSDTNLHSIKLELTRVATGVQIDFFIDGTKLSTATDTTAQISTFDEIGFNYSSNKEHRFDNIKLEAIAAAPGDLPLTYPPDAGIINVKDAPYNAVGDGVTDDTAAIRSAINNPNNYDTIIYFPAGTYRVSDTIECNSTKTSSNWRRVYLFGSGSTHTKIKLTNSAPGFTSATSPRPVLRWLQDNTDSNAFGDGFRNALADMTIDVGSANPGATGIKWIGHNQSFIRNVIIQSSDANRQGKYGLDLSLVAPGPTMVRGLTVRGFDYGIYMVEGKGMWFTNLELQNQRLYGIWNERQVFAVENLISTNSVPVYYSRRRSGTSNGWGQFVLIGGNLSGGASSATAIDNTEGGGLYVRDVTSVGYGNLIKSFDDEANVTDVVPGGSVTEFVSHNPRSLFGSSPTSLRLAIEDTPSIAHDPLNLWYNVKTSGAKGDGATDDTAAIQAGLNSAAASGKTTVYFPKGTYKISGTLSVTGGVKRIFGAAARLAPADPLKSSTNAIFKAQHTSPYLAIDHFEGNYVSGNYCLAEHNSPQPLILRNIKNGGGAPYKNTSSNNKLFIEDVAFNRWVFTNGLSIWARQFNTEGNMPDFNVKNQGCRLWVLGQKTEGSSVTIETSAGGQTELLGGLVDGRAMSDGSAPPDSFVNVESMHSLVYTAINKLHEPQVREVRGGVTATMPSNQLVTKQYGRIMPLFLGK